MVHALEDKKEIRHALLHLAAEGQVQKAIALYKVFAKYRSDIIIAFKDQLELCNTMNLRSEEVCDSKNSFYKVSEDGKKTRYLDSERYNDACKTSLNK